MRVLVTGGQGFIGSRLLDFLQERKYQVRVLTRRPAPDLELRGMEVFQADLQNLEAVRRAVTGMEGVIHCAAKSGVWGPLNDYIRANTHTTINLLSAAQRAGAAWFVHTSSPSVVHTGLPLDGVDESTPYAEDPSQPYPYSKMLAERLVLAADGPGFHTVALRPHLVWGPGDPHFLPRLVAKAQAGHLWLLKSEALVDGTFVDNAAGALLIAAERMQAGGAWAESIGGKAYFIGQGEPLTAPDLIARLLAAASTPEQALTVRGLIPPKLGLAAGTALEKIWPLFRLRGEPPLTRFVAEELSLPHWFSLYRARNELGYQPFVSMADGLLILAESRRRKRAQKA